MSYIAFELDALNVVPDVASAASLRPGDVSLGLLRLWAWCFREHKDVVADVHLRGFFGGDATAALEAFGFVVRVPEGFRVRGAERYLRVAKQRSMAGKSRSSSAGRSAGRFTSEPPANNQRTTSDSPALTPSTKHLAPNTLERIPGADAPAPVLTVVRQTKKPKAERPTDPRHAPLVAVLVQVFLESRGATYGFTRRDAASVQQLLALGEPDNIEARWRRALAHVGFPSVATLGELVTHWNRFAGAGTVDNRSPVAAEAVDWTGVIPGEVAL